MMSLAGATVITNLFTAIPLVGVSIAHWLWGGYAVGDPTLNRFFALHYLLPFMIVGVVVLHVWALHIAGQNNPDGVEVKNVERDTVAFTPYATIKDVFGLSVFLIVYAWFTFFIPLYLLDPDNSTMANPLVTPSHIVPEWYLLPFYAILGRFRTSWSASLRCSRRSLCSPFFLGSTPRRSSRPNTGRSTASSSGSSSSAASDWDIWVRKRSPTKGRWSRGFWRLAISAFSSSFFRYWA